MVFKATTASPSPAGCPRILATGTVHPPTPGAGGREKKFLGTLISASRVAQLVLFCVGEAKKPNAQASRNEIGERGRGEGRGLGSGLGLLRHWSWRLKARERARDPQTYIALGRKSVGIALSRSGWGLSVCSDSSRAAPALISKNLTFIDLKQLMVSRAGVRWRGWNPIKSQTRVDGGREP